MRPIRRDGEGRPQVGPTWESLIERQIRESMAAGDFDNLPYRGEPIPIDDDGSEMALAHHVLRQAGFAPGWVATDVEIRLLLARRDELLERARHAATRARERDRTRHREVMRGLVAEVNRLVLRLEHEAPTPRQHRRRLDLDAELAALESAFGGDEGSGGESPDRQ
jgi:hypothetical protein